MDGIDNARHDLDDAQGCLETAIELLSSIDNDQPSEGLEGVIGELRGLYQSLERTASRLEQVARKTQA